VEVRHLPLELLNIENQISQPNIFFAGNDVLVCGSFKEILEYLTTSQLSQNVKSEIIKAVQNFEKSEIINYKIGKKSFDFNYAYVMGILNVTPDSFSDGGKYTDKSSALSYALEMIEEGVDIIDVGGESTRPGSDPVSEKEEIKRVIPVIIEILKKKSDAIISIDTTKAKVAEEALNNGALIVNDISGGTFEPEIFNMVRTFNAAMIIMHIKGKPKTMQDSPVYADVFSEVYDYLSAQSDKAFNHGIEKIIIDPGIGFGKRLEDNLSVIERLEDFKSLGFPLMVGVSRKSFIGNILNLSVEDRDDATNAINSFSLIKGVRIIRTHNIKKAVQTCNLFNTLIRN
jgi:dihydropteroate synthase